MMHTHAAECKHFQDLGFISGGRSRGVASSADLQGRDLYRRCARGGDACAPLTLPLHLTGTCHTRCQAACSLAL